MHRFDESIAIEFNRVLSNGLGMPPIPHSQIRWIPAAVVVAASALVILTSEISSDLLALGSRSERTSLFSSSDLFALEVLEL